ncbi:TauD/TfdA dioxygenase family protein [Bordetella sp. 02P26C-1]|uniref:TauD/TfdA dioxygenase family protein n=1 Tax=Bordetella sp. 02P26C-1 TaxID=2683195 RepID=UPI0013552A13|nr:TauD/TfdA family dioxygenase [Bordetella sp. 02P26C-1]MVW78204.1 taurine dioxygenase [Bordetella sp. 02P26C-1]
MKIIKLTGTIGAEIHGVDVSKPLTPEMLAQIRQCLLDHCVIFFRDQTLTKEQQIAFVRQFGAISKSPVYKTLDSHPEIMPVIKEPTDRDIIGDTWHTDETYQETPPMGSVLYAREVPAVGGDTLWCNLYRAYETLSDGLKQQLEGMRAVHTNEFLTGNTAARNATRSTKLLETVGVNYVVHPVVRTHDETGRKCLFVNQPFTHAFEGMTRAESLPLLQYLYAHASKPENTCRFRWRKGSIAFWDNRCTMHYAINDYPGQRREMHRITLQGTRPV